MAKSGQYPAQRLKTSLKDSFKQISLIASGPNTNTPLWSQAYSFSCLFLLLFYENIECPRISCYLLCPELSIPLYPHGLFRLCSSVNLAEKGFPDTLCSIVLHTLCYIIIRSTWSHRSSHESINIIKARILSISFTVLSRASRTESGPKKVVKIYGTNPFRLWQMLKVQ